MNAPFQPGRRRSGGNGDCRHLWPAGETSPDGNQETGYNATAGAFLDRHEIPDYVIVYRPETVPLQVVAVLHGKRDLKEVLERRS